MMQIIDIQASGNHLIKPTQGHSDKVSTKGDLRRRRIIDAAAQCFRMEGFHGASIARIAKLAEMSPGHLYHYFPTKDQIVEAIVEEEESELGEFINALDGKKGQGDFLTTISAQIEAMIERSLQPQYLCLMLEISAEAARNPKIAQVLQQSDQRVAERFAQMARELGGVAAAQCEDEAEFRARLEILPVLFAGLAQRSIHNGALDRAQMVRLVKDILNYLWSSTP